VRGSAFFTDRPKLERSILELEAEREDLWEKRHTFGEDFWKKRAPNIATEIASKKKVERIKARPKEDVKFDLEVVKLLNADIASVFASNATQNSKNTLKSSRWCQSLLVESSFGMRSRVFTQPGP
jgi:hypothetical protein